MKISLWLRQCAGPRTDLQINAHPRTWSCWLIPLLSRQWRQVHGSFRSTISSLVFLTLRVRLLFWHHSITLLYSVIVTHRYIQQRLWRLRIKDGIGAVSVYTVMDSERLSRQPCGAPELIVKACPHKWWMPVFGCASPRRIGYHLVNFWSSSCNIPVSVRMVELLCKFKSMIHVSCQFHPPD